MQQRNLVPKMVGRRLKQPANLMDPFLRWAVQFPLDRRIPKQSTRDRACAPDNAPADFFCGSAGCRASLVRPHHRAAALEVPWDGLDAAAGTNTPRHSRYLEDSWELPAASYFPLPLMRGYACGASWS